ncbi:RDD family protein [Jiangella rhizosphaerae]|uniref:RDD family protein n=1 Tax=Jiangella rhizosphaerae TaxID=2293569 RepID=A0A418KRQ8_9ACTN|nr:RDD family protein [Jiangella rhizosphaerae]
MSRCAAALVDAAVVAAASALTGFVLSGIRYTVDGPPFSLPPVPGWAIGVGHSVLVLLYLTVSWTLVGCTPGQLVLGLRVVTADGRPPGPWRALVRALVCVVLPIGVLWLLFSRRTLAVQDLVARTVLVYDPPRW